MNGIDLIADTNILLYILEENPSVAELTENFLMVSVISEIELLGYKDITKSEAKAIRALLDDCFVIGLTHEIKETAILLKQKRKIKIPDAIVAATSIISGIPLVTADVAFKKIPGLQVAIVEL